MAQVLVAVAHHGACGGWHVYESKADKDPKCWASKREATAYLRSTGAGVKGFIMKVPVCRR